MASVPRNPGALSRRVELQTPVTALDGLGGTIDGWTALAYLWARIVPLRQESAETGERLQATLTHEVTIRYRTGVRAGQRFLHRGRALRILSCADAGEERRFLVCSCEEEK